jgi:hypothetical protein
MTTGTTRRALTLVRVALVLCAVVASATVAAPPARAQIEFVTVTLDSVTIGSQPGTVVVSGTVTCGSPVEAFVYGDVAQVQGLDIARDIFGVPVQCSGSASTWTATSFGSLRVFLPVETIVNVNAQYCIAETCYSDSTSGTLDLPASPSAAVPVSAVDVAVAVDEELTGGGVGVNGL